MAKVKICGLKRLEDIEIVNQYLPEYIGFVFAESKRRIDFEEAKKLKEVLDKRIEAVGVFVNESLEQVEYLCKANIIDIVQLHGDEDDLYLHELRKRIDKKIIKAIRVRSRDEIIKYSELPFDDLLLDSYEAGKYGGSGKVFDHSLVPELNKKIWIAGGINEGNVLTIIEKMNPYAVDISSGVETNGYKDEIKIKSIIEIIRAKARLL